MSQALGPLQGSRWIQAITAVTISGTGTQTRKLNYKSVDEEGNKFTNKQGNEMAVNLTCAKL